MTCHFQITDPGTTSAVAHRKAEHRLFSPFSRGPISPTVPAAIAGAPAFLQWWEIQIPRAMAVQFAEHCALGRPAVSPEGSVRPDRRNYRVFLRLARRADQPRFRPQSPLPVSKVRQSFHLLPMFAAPVEAVPCGRAFRCALKEAREGIHRLLAPYSPAIVLLDNSAEHLRSVVGYGSRRRRPNSSGQVNLHGPIPPPYLLPCAVAEPFRFRPALSGIPAPSPGDQFCQRIPVVDPSATSRGRPFDKAALHNPG